MKLGVQRHILRVYVAVFYLFPKARKLDHTRSRQPASISVSLLDGSASGGVVHALQGDAVQNALQELDVLGFVARPGTETGSRGMAWSGGGRGPPGGREGHHGHMRDIHGGVG